MHCIHLLVYYTNGEGLYSSTAVGGGARVSRKSSPTSILRSNCDLGVRGFRRSMFLIRRSQYLAVFGHPLESRRDRLLYPQRVLLEKRGAIAPFAPLPPGYATVAASYLARPPPFYTRMWRSEYRKLTERVTGNLFERCTFKRCSLPLTKSLAMAVKSKLSSCSLYMLHGSVGAGS